MRRLLPQTVSEREVLDRTPPADKALVAGLPVGIVSLHNKAGFDLKIETGFVREVDADVVVATFGRELNGFDGFAPGFWKA